MQNLFSLSLLAAACVLFVGCNSEVTKKCEEVADKFYEDIKAKKYEATASLMDESLKKDLTQEAWLGLFKAFEEFGDIQSYKRTGMQTGMMDGVQRYQLTYEVQRAQKVFYESIDFVQRDKDYKIAAYQYSTVSPQDAAKEEERLKSFIASFYKNMQAGNPQANIALLDSLAIAPGATPVEGWMALMNEALTKMGKPVNYTQQDYQVNSNGLIVTDYTVEYESGKKEFEHFELVDRPDGLKILSYQLKPTAETVH